MVTQSGSDRIKRIYYHHKENGLCVRCGKTNDRPWTTLCVKCREKQTRQQAETRKWYREHGICHCCGKEKLYGVEKRCLECSAKSYEYKAEHPITEEQRIRYNNNFKQQQRNLYKERAEQGICTRCGKQKADYGRKKCRMCLDKNRISKYRREDKLLCNT